VSDYDAVLLVSFGGPEGPAEVLPFLQRVTAGRGIPDERLAEVGEHYYLFGGVSPINAQNRELLACLRTALPAAGLDLPVYWGNRNSAPFLADTLAQMATDGIRRALAVVTAAYSSYSGCRQYRENIAAAAAEVGPQAPVVDKVRHYFDHPGFVGAFVDATVAALATLPPAVADDARLVFTTHSIPTAQALASGPDGDGYVTQHAATAALVAAGVQERTGRPRAHDLVFQSRSGPAHQPWLEPDISDHLADLAAQGVPGVVAVPIGFVSDHMEVVYDLDTVAAADAARLGLPFARAATPGTDPQFVAALVDLVAERVRDTPPAERRCLSRLGPLPDRCAAACCPNPRGDRPAVAQAPA